MAQEKIITVGMYADQTGLFSDEVVNAMLNGEYGFEGNWVEMEMPEWIVRHWYERRKNDFDKETAKELDIPVNEATFEDWINKVYVGEDMDGLYEFAINNGVQPVFGTYQMECWNIERREQ